MKNVKKILATLLLVCASPALHAYDAYIGGALGIASFDGSYRALDGATGERHYARNGGLSFLGGGQIGVEEWFDNCWSDCGCGYLGDFYAALELNFLYNSYSRTIRTDTDGTGVLNSGLRLKNDFIFGVDLKWGTRFCSATPYIVTGYTLGVWDFRLLNDSGTTTTGIPSGGDRHQRTKSGFKLGAGVRYDVCECVFWDLQYSYTWFGNLHRNFETNTWRHRIDLNQQRVVFGFNWTFGG